MQVSPVEIENILLAHPEKLISDVTVAGVSGGRTADEKVPRAWIVLSETGGQVGEAAVFNALNEWSRSNLSKYKWLRGGIEIIDRVSLSLILSSECSKLDNEVCLGPKISYRQSSAQNSAG